MVKRALFTSLLVMMSSTAGAAVPDVLLEKGLMEVSASALQQWNFRSDEVFRIVGHDGCLQVDLGAEVGADAIAVQLGGNFYEGADHGEWGGELAVSDAAGNRRVLLKENVRALLPAAQEILVFTGLAHLGTSRGAVHRVVAADSNPRVERVTLLPDAPAVVVDAPYESGAERVVILGSSSVMVLSELGGEDRLEVPLVRQPWATLYPSSAAIVDGFLVFGMRGGIGVLPVPSSLGPVVPPRYFTLPGPTGTPAAGARIDQVNVRLPFCLQ